MAAPATINEFLELVRKSGVLDEKRLDAYLVKLRGSATTPTEPAKLAGMMVRDGLLTHFQAEQIMLGKWRRFTIGKYKVLERLGSGGMGSVYLCEHKLMRRRVAVKVLPAAKASDPSALERFYREARAVAALDHPNIVHAYDIDQDENLHFLVMEYVDGASMQEIVKKTGPMDPIRAAHYIRQAAIGLDHAHRAGLVHRDIKPGNLLVDRTGTVKVLDMGLARFFNDEDDVLTKKYDENVLGTADYLAPEQALDSHAVDIRADIYSLGATFYFLLTGRTPFGEGTVAQKLIWHQTRQPKPVTIFRQDIPPGLMAIIDKMMAKDPGQRFAAPDILDQALEPWTQNPIPPPVEAEMPRLSPAATGMPPVSTEAATMVTANPSPSGPTSPAKVWTVTTTPRPTPYPAVPAPPQSPPPTPATPRGGVNIPLKPASSKFPVQQAQATSPAPPQAPAQDGGLSPSPVTRPTTPTPTPSPVAVQEAATSEAAGQESAADAEAPWQDLVTDTVGPTAKSDTTPQGPRSGPRRRSLRQSPPMVEDRRLWIVVSAVAFFCVLLLVSAGWFFFFRKPEPVGPPVRPSLIVTKDLNRAGAFRSIQHALGKAQDGDVIELWDERHEENLQVTGEPNRVLHVTIRPAAGKNVIWMPAYKDPTRKLLTLYRASGLHLKGPGLTLDGTIDAAKKVFVQDLVQLMVFNKGVTLEDVTLRGFSQTGILFTNCAGEQGQPVRLHNLEITAVADVQPKAAIYFEAFANFTPSVNDFIEITDSCRFFGMTTKDAIKKKDDSVLGSHVLLPTSK